MRKFWRVTRWILLAILLLAIAGLYYFTKAGFYTFDSRFTDAIAVHTAVYNSLGGNVERALPDSLIAPLEETISYLEANEAELSEVPAYAILLSDLYLLYANDLGIRMRYQEAINYYYESEKQLKGATNWYPLKNLSLGNIHNLLHLAYSSNDELLKAEENITEAISYFEAANDDRWIGMGRMNQARINSLQGDYEKAITNAGISIEAFSRIKMNHVDSTFLLSAYRRRASDYAVLAQLAEKREDNSKKETYTEQARAACNFILTRKDWFSAEEQTYQWPVLLQDIAMHWLDSPLRVYTDEIEGMLIEIEEGLRRSVRPGVDPYRATHRILKGEWLLSVDREEEATSEIRRGLDILGYTVDEKWAIAPRDYSQPVVTTALMIYNRILPTLLKKQHGRALLTAQRSVVETVQGGGKYISGDVSQASQTTQERSIYTGTIRTALELLENDNVTAVDNINFLAECQRAQILRRNLQRSNLVEQLQGPEQLWLSKDEALKKKLGDFVAKLSRTEDDEEITELESRINGVKREREALQRNPPAGIREGFFQLFALPQLPSLGELRRSMKQEEAIIQFIEMDQTLLVMTITKASVNIHETAPFPEWEDDLQKFKWSMKEDKGSAFFTQSARSLFDVCLAPALTTLPATTHELTIITDGPLRGLNLEVFLRSDTDSENYRQLDYLFKKYSISYEYLLATLYDHLQQNDDQISTKMAICAPPYITTPAYCKPPTAIDSLYQLGVELAEQNDDTKLVVSTKEAMKTISRTSENIFFAAHGIISEENPMQSYLLLSPDEDEDCRLSIGELINWTFPNTDIVLGSCTTEAGKNIGGSGILSIAQAMTIAGARSLIANTDYIKDEPATKLFRMYFGFREQGLPKNEALRKAKLTYLKTEDDGIMPPMFWSNTILIGHKD